MKQSLILILLGISFQVYSTKYISSKIIVNSDTFYTTDFFLSKLLDEKKKCFFLNPDLITLTWKIENSKIYLFNDSNINFADCSNTFESKIYKFSDIISNEPIDSWFLADFVSDTLQINYGKSAAFPRMGTFESGYKNYYEKEKDIIIRNGIILAINDFENSDNNENHLSIFNELTIDSIVSILNEGINWKALPKVERDWIQEIFIVTITPEGNSIISLYDEESIMAGNYSSEYKEVEKYKKEVARILNPLKWNVIKKHGIPLTIHIFFDIEFDFENKVVINPYTKKYE